MKKIIALLLLFVCLTSVILFVACDKETNSTNSDITDAECAHKWGQYSGKATCSSGDYIVYKCAYCSETKEEYEPAYGCSDVDGDNYCNLCFSYLGSNNVPNNNVSHTHTSTYYERKGNKWEHYCDCGEVYYEDIDFFNEVVEYVKNNGEYNNYTYMCKVGSNVASGYVYDRYVSYDLIDKELCFILTFGQYMRLEIYITKISREYKYYFEDRESHCFIRGIIDTRECGYSYYCFTDEDNIENTNVSGAYLYTFAEIVQSQVKLFIACFNNDYAHLYITAQDFCFPVLN